ARVTGGVCDALFCAVDALEAITSKTARIVSASCAIGPTTSVLHDIGIIPLVGITPFVGLRAVTPQNAAGMRTDPLTSVPIPKGTTRVATETAVPLEDPPDHRAVSHGFSVGPLSGTCIPPTANSVVESFAIGMAPADIRRRMTSAAAS